MSTKENRFEIGDLVKVPRGLTIYRPGGGLALVIERHPVTKRYRIKWCQSGKDIWVREDVLTPAY